MGKKLIIKGADFSVNKIVPSKEEMLMNLLNSNVQTLGFRYTTNPSSEEIAAATNIYRTYYSERWSTNRCATNNGGIPISEITALGITEFEVTLLGGRKAAFVVGDSAEAIPGTAGTWAYITRSFVINLADHNGKNWLEDSDTVYLLIQVAPSDNNSSEVMEADYSKYLSLEVLDSE